ncbi:hypothetical protein BJX99DRAFT_5237 [Aspergillus californicus]
MILCLGVQRSSRSVLADHSLRRDWFSGTWSAARSTRKKTKVKKSCFRLLGHKFQRGDKYLASAAGLFLYQSIQLVYLDFDGLLSAPAVRHQISVTSD